MFAGSRAVDWQVAICDAHDVGIDHRSDFPKGIEVLNAFAGMQ